jgi:hypothetical protein
MNPAEHEIELVLRQVFLSGLILGHRLQSLPSKLAQTIADLAERGEGEKIQELLAAAVEDVLAEALGGEKPHRA